MCPLPKMQLTGTISYFDIKFASLAKFGTGWLQQQQQSAAGEGLHISYELRKNSRGQKLILLLQGLCYRRSRGQTASCPLMRVSCPDEIITCNTVNGMQGL